MLRRMKCRYLVAVDETAEACLSQRRSEEIVMPIGKDTSQQKITGLHQGSRKPK